jgi:signal transduction histidine kinase
MLLADFISESLEPILLEWEGFARGIKPGETMDSLALRDHAGEILLATVRDMRSSQTSGEQSAKSRGHEDDRTCGALNGASEQHAIGRLGSGFDLMEVVSEYRALRASVLRQWHEKGFPSQISDVDDITRFNESIDQSLAKAISSYTTRVDQSRELFLAILSHDLRNPLSSISMSAALLTYLVPPAAETLKVVSQISTNANVMARMISDLLDYTRTRLGAGMPVSPTRMDLGLLCKELFNEFQTAHPGREISLELQGELLGTWDSDRLRQAISNLIGNAIQHSPDDALVQLKATGEASVVDVVINNGGPPIEAGELERIFEPLVRGSSANHPVANRPGSIGLGLYIAREIAQSHGGTLKVSSNGQSGTTFRMCLPRSPIAVETQPILDEKHLQTM